ncbi:MAG: cytochrome c oxidase assembly factor Coa1 family protein [Pirellulales bacterium]|nr:cytochrome c oxidase assembly factor Coa1 family protein [Pirellulales bacterium]
MTATAPAAPVAQRRLISWKWYPAIFFGMLLLLIMAGGLVMYIQGQNAINSPPYQLTLREIQASAQVQAKIGQPITNATWYPAVKITDNGEKGEALCQFEVYGPLGTLEIKSQLRKLAGEWSPTELGYKQPGVLEYTSIMKEYLAKNKSDVPIFDGQTPAKTTTKIDLPPPDLDFSIENTPEEKK